MATEVIMPQMGESIAEGTITRWLVAVGDKVDRDQPLFEISTDKVDAEIPSPASGILLEIRYKEGTTVEVNEVVALIGAKGEEAVREPAAERAEVATPVPSAVGDGEPAPAGGPASGAVQEPEPADAAVAGAEEPEPELAERLRRRSSPVVRKIAEEEGVELSEVIGTGLHGRVTKRDILGYLGERASAPAGPEPKAPQVMPAVRRERGDFYIPAYSEGERVEIEPMSKIRQITAAHMSYSKATSAHVTSVFHMDLSRVARLRQRAKGAFAREHGTKLTYMPFIFKAVASSLKAHPKLNSAIDGDSIVFKKDIHLGMAVALDWGLIVPVIRHADQLNLVGLARAANDLADRARSKRLSPDEVQGGTFTVTNPGVFGSLFGTPIINQPQVGILGIGTIEKRPVVESDDEGNDTIAIKTMSYFAITFDHRLVDGADADRFMIDVRRTLLEESWSELDPFL